MSTALRLGTRGSALALAQSQLVAEALTERTGRPVELVRIQTAGDTSAAPVAQLGVGVFVSALRDALIAGEIDFAVHSYKDLPTAADPRLHIAAVPQRVDPRDALIARDGLTLTELPPESVIGTG
ncbi:MAG: hydroxymethylbilane synthase, partial [Actinoplanes sp.]|nr:hydroxymethylbilane synthase [Actinoplanes sp.]